MAVNGRVYRQSVPVDGSAALKLESAPEATRRPRREAARRTRPVEAARASSGRESESEPQQRRRAAPAILVGVLAVAAVVRPLMQEPQPITHLLPHRPMPS